MISYANFKDQQIFNDNIQILLEDSQVLKYKSYTTMCQMIIYFIYINSETYILVHMVLLLKISKKLKEWFKISKMLKILRQLEQEHRGKIDKPPNQTISPPYQWETWRIRQTLRDLWVQARFILRVKIADFQHLEQKFNKLNFKPHVYKQQKMKLYLFHKYPGRDNHIETKSGVQR